MNQSDLQAPTAESVAESAVTKTEFVVFQTSSIHGTGGFACKDIPVETRVIRYVGEEITKAESLRRCELNNEFIFDLDEERDIDGSVSWNPARFINHSCDPNCEAQSEDGEVWIVAIRDIKDGEEITFNYNYDLEDYRDHPCRCGAPSCVGYIVAEEYFDSIRLKAGASV